MTFDMVADTLTRVRNAGMAGHKVVKIRATLKTRRIVQLLHDEGYISSFESFTLPRHRDTKATERRKDRTGRTRKGVVSKFFLLKLKYVNVRSKGMKVKLPLIEELRCLSKPGGRFFVQSRDLLGASAGETLVVSTSEGLLTGRQACFRGLGGEVWFSLRTCFPMGRNQRVMRGG
jgi:small subunit ribosomal protein S8